MELPAMSGPDGRMPWRLNFLKKLAFKGLTTLPKRDIFEVRKADFHIGKYAL